MTKNLVIVESPAKAKTIEGFLGKDFTVKSSFGHIRDLKQKNLAVDIENEFEPQYEVPTDKKKIVAELKKLAKGADLIWLASDEDREGEAISWHLFEALGLDEKKVKRIVFHEITKTAIDHAIANPRAVNKNLVDAQQARRVLDRLVGYEISPILWKKVKPSLSAGRVQSVAVRLLVEREREIQQFSSTSAFKVVAYFMAGKSSFKAELPQRFKTEEEATAFLEKCKSANFNVASLEKKPSIKSPAAPFTTSTLQQEASRKLGFSVSQTMTIAQRLYESGKITYMRTDSVNLSDLAMNAAKAEIIKQYGPEYSKPTKYQTKSKGAQEAHEAIRPTYLNVATIDGDYGQQQLYSLIWKRTVASQMSQAQLEKTTVKINISTTEENFVARGEMITFEGFLKVYIESNDDETESDDDKEGMLPNMSTGDKLNLDHISATEKFALHPPRYTEASLVRKLEDLGIGRPSTYAPTISTIQRRGYSVKEEREGTERNYRLLTLKNDAFKREVKQEITGREKNKLFPTDIGMVVNDFLISHFEHILDYQFTADVEKQFDSIAEGQKKWNQMIAEFYSPFHKSVETTLENAERASGERILGEEPGTGKVILVRIGRFGPMAQIGSSEEEEKPRFASLLKHQSIETITLDEVMDLFKLPRKLGEYNGYEISVAIGRFGPYVRHNGLFASIKKQDGDDPFTIDRDRCIELIEQKIKADKEKFIKTFSENEEVQILKGRWGPYIKIGRKNYKIPKDKTPEDLTLEECIAISKEEPKGKGKVKPKAKTKAKTKKK
jgi:DNA topoisomerase-1